MNCPSCGSNTLDEQPGAVWFSCGSIASNSGSHQSMECQSRRELSEANEYARKLGIKVTNLGSDIERLKTSLHQWRKLAEMLIELQSDEFPAGGEAMIDKERDAADLYRELKESKP